MAKGNANKPAENAEQPRIRKWLRPSRRAKGYAEERKENRHKRGDKKGEELDDYNKGLRSGYLLCQSDHAGSYIYDKVLGETKDKDKRPQLRRVLVSIEKTGVISNGKA